MSGGYFSSLWASEPADEKSDTSAAVSGIHIQNGADVIQKCVNDKSILLQDSSSTLRAALLALVASGQLESLEGKGAQQQQRTGNADEEEKMVMTTMTTQRAAVTATHDKNDMKSKITRKKRNGLFTSLPSVLLGHIVEWMKSLDELRLVEEALEGDPFGKLCWQRGIAINAMRPNANAFCSRLEYDSRDALLWSARTGLLVKQKHPVRVAEWLRGKWRTHFTWMCENNMTNCVNSMLERADTDVNEVDNGGWGALDYASFEGHVDIVRKLMNRGANVNKPGNKQKRTPLHEACRNGHLAVVQLLISKVVNINQKNYTGWTPLYLAMYGGHEKVEKFLLSKGAKPYASEDIDSGERIAEGWGNLDRIVIWRESHKKEAKQKEAQQKEVRQKEEAAKQASEPPTQQEQTE